MYPPALGSVSPNSKDVYPSLSTRLGHDLGSTTGPQSLQDAQAIAASISQPLLAAPTSSILPLGATRAQNLSDAAHYATVRPPPQPLPEGLDRLALSASLAPQASRPGLGQRNGSNYTNSTLRPSPRSSPPRSASPPSPPANQHSGPFFEHGAESAPLTPSRSAAGEEVRSPTVAERLEKGVESPVQPSGGSWSTDTDTSSSTLSDSSRLHDQSRHAVHHHKSLPPPPRQHTVASPLSDEVRAKSIASPDSWRSLLPESDPFYASEAVLASRYEAELTAKRNSMRDLKLGAKASRQRSTSSLYNNSTCPSPYLSAKRLSNSSTASIQSALSLPPPQDTRSFDNSSANVPSWRTLLPDNDPSVVRERALRQKVEREHARQMAAVEAARHAEAAKSAVIFNRHSANAATSGSPRDEDARRAVTSKHTSCPPSSSSKVARCEAIPPPVPPKSPQPTGFTTSPSEDGVQSVDGIPWPRIPDPSQDAGPSVLRYVGQAIQHHSPTSLTLCRDVHVELFPHEYVIKAAMPPSRFNPESFSLSFSQERILRMTVKGADEGSFTRSVPFRVDTDADLGKLRAYNDGENLVVIVRRRAEGAVGIDEVEAEAEMSARGSGGASNDSSISGSVDDAAWKSVTVSST